MGSSFYFTGFDVNKGKGQKLEHHFSLKFNLVDVDAYRPFQLDNIISLTIKFRPSNLLLRVVRVVRLTLAHSGGP